MDKEYSFLQTQLHEGAVPELILVRPFYYRTSQDTLSWYITDRRRDEPIYMWEAIYRYYFRNNGLLVKDSAISDINAYYQVVTNYASTPGVIAIQRDGFSYLQDNRYYQQRNAAGDITLQTDTMHTINYGVGEAYLRNKFTTSYRAEANPLYVAMRPIENDLIPYDWNIDTWFVASKQLMSQRTLEEHYSSAGVPDWRETVTISYSYTLDAAGRITGITANSSTGKTRKLLLTYF